MTDLGIIKAVAKLAAAVIALSYDTGVLVSAVRFRKRLLSELEHAGKNEIIETDDGGLFRTLATGVMMTAVTAFVIIGM